MPEVDVSAQLEKLRDTQKKKLAVLLEDWSSQSPREKVLTARLIMGWMRIPLKQRRKARRALIPQGSVFATWVDGRLIWHRLSDSTSNANGQLAAKMDRAKAREISRRIMAENHELFRKLAQ